MLISDYLRHESAHICGVSFSSIFPLTFADVVAPISDYLRNKICAHLRENEATGSY